MSTGWDGIEEFLATYDRGSFSSAAAALGVSPSHISRAIAGLEDKLQAPLFFRTTRRVRATETGHAFAERCRHMIEDRENAFAAITENGAPQGTLRITCSIAFGELYVAPVVRQFVEDNPQVQAVLELDNRVLDLIAEGYDLAIRTGDLTDSRLIATRIASRRLHLCASPDYIAKNGALDTLEDLANHSCLIGTSPIWHFSNTEKAVEFRPKGRWRCNSGFAVVDAAVAGLGVCQLPHFYVREFIETGALKDLLPERAPTPEPVWAVYPHRHHLQPKVRRFIDLLQSTLAEAADAKKIALAGQASGGRSAAAKSAHSVPSKAAQRGQ